MLWELGSALAGWATWLKYRLHLFNAWGRDWPIINMLKGKLRGLEVQDGGMSLCCVLRQGILLSEFLSPDKSRNGYN